MMEFSAIAPLLIMPGICAVLVIALCWAGARHLRRRMADAGTRVPPDWSAIDGYADLSIAASEWWSLSPDAFLDGPFRRYLELASVPGDSPRVGARILEFCRGSIGGFARELDRRGDDGASFERRARAIAETWFAGEPHADYMIEVLDGVSNHNYRVTRTEADGAAKD